VIYPQSKLTVTKMKKNTSPSLRATGAAGNVAPGQGSLWGNLSIRLNITQDMIFFNLLTWVHSNYRNIKYVWTL
jgi:hypothetical protein